MSFFNVLAENGDENADENDDDEEEDKASESIAAMSDVEKAGFDQYKDFLEKEENGSSEPHVQDEKFIKSNWLKLRQNGGTNYPTETFSKDLDGMEEIFLKYHSVIKICAFWLNCSWNWADC